MMTSVAILYFSGSGHTHLMAEAIASGVQRVADSQAELLRIEEQQFTGGRWESPEILAKLTAADAIIFGSPTYMGCVAAQFKAFADATGGQWFAQAWKNKFAGGFTHSSSLSGDKQSTLLYLATFAAQHCMIWLGTGTVPSEYIDKQAGFNRLGSFLGVMGQSNPTENNIACLDEGDRFTAECYGIRIADAAKRWNRA